MLYSKSLARIRKYSFDTRLIKPKGEKCMSVKRNHLYIIMLLSICFLLCAAFCAVRVSEPGYWNLFLLPLTLLFSLWILNRIIFHTIQFLPFFVLYMIEVVRFLVIPFLMVYTGFYHSTFYGNPSTGGMTKAIYLMCYELVAITFMLFIYKKKLLALQRQAVDVTDDETESWLLIVIALVLIGFVLLFCRMNNLIVRLSIGPFTLAVGTRIFVAGENILISALMLLYIPVLKKWIHSRQRLSDHIIFLVLSVVWMFTSFGDARMVYIVKAVEVILLFFRYANIRVARNVSVFLIVLAMIAVVGMTLLDENASRGTFFFTASAEQRHTYAYTLTKYFSGPYNVAKSVDIAKGNLFTTSRPQLLVNDILYNTYPFSGLLEEGAETTKIIFNHSLYGSYEKATQIVPLVGQGVIYFGYAFSVIPTLVFLWMLIKWQTKINNKNTHASIERYFMASYFSVYLGFMFMYNVIILSGILWNTWIMLFIGIKICSVIKGQINLHRR